MAPRVSSRQCNWSPAAVSRQVLQRRLFSSRSAPKDDAVAVTGVHNPAAVLDPADGPSRRESRHGRRVLEQSKVQRARASESNVCEMGAEEETEADPDYSSEYARSAIREGYSISNEAPPDEAKH